MGAGDDGLELCFMFLKEKEENGLQVPRNPCPSKSSWLCQLGPLNCRNASKGRALIPLNGLAMIGGPELSVPPLNPVVLSVSLDCNLLFRAWRPHVIDTWGRLLCVRSTSLRDTFGDSVVRQRDEKLGTYANRNMTILYIHAE